MRSILVFSVILLPLATVYAAPLDNSYVETPDPMANGTVYSISHLFPKVFMKTDEFVINHKMCVQFSYKLMEKKVKLRAYTCLLSEGGFCTLDKFVYPTDQNSCTYLRPWTMKEENFSFYFVLERRPRRYGSRAKSRRITKRQESLSGRPIGQVKIEGLIPCEKVCNYKKGRPY